MRSKNHRYLSVKLTVDEYNYLTMLAGRERRSPGNKASMIIVDKLKEDGYVDMSSTEESLSDYLLEYGVE